MKHNRKTAPDVPQLSLILLSESAGLRSPERKKIQFAHQHFVCFRDGLTVNFGFSPFLIFPTFTFLHWFVIYIFNKSSQTIGSLAHISPNIHDSFLIFPNIMCFCSFFPQIHAFLCILPSNLYILYTFVFQDCISKFR